jgi:hypothetical protein
MGGAFFSILLRSMVRGERLAASEWRLVTTTSSLTTNHSPLAIALLHESPLISAGLARKLKKFYFRGRLVFRSVVLVSFAG